MSNLHWKVKLILCISAQDGVISETELDTAYKLINDASFIKPFGLAVHVGSQLFDYDVFFQTFDQ